jgi:hypothetical protein
LLIRSGVLKAVRVTMLCSGFWHRGNSRVDSFPSSGMKMETVCFSVCVCLWIYMASNRRTASSSRIRSSLWPSGICRCRGVTVAEG